MSMDKTYKHGNTYYLLSFWDDIGVDGPKGAFVEYLNENKDEIVIEHLETNIVGQKETCIFLGDVYFSIVPANLTASGELEKQIYFKVFWRNKIIWVHEDFLLDEVPKI